MHVLCRRKRGNFHNSRNPEDIDDFMGTGSTIKEGGPIREENMYRNMAFVYDSSGNEKVAEMSTSRYFKVGIVSRVGSH